MNTATQVEVKERPIIFSGPMVRAILEGRKTQTRRVVRFPVTRQRIGGRPEGGPDAFKATPMGRDLHITLSQSGIVFDTQSGRPSKALQDKILFCPHGKPGDHLWVRETWRTEERESDLVDGIRFRADDHFQIIEDTQQASENWVVANNNRTETVWRPSMFLPRWASRITLEITDIRVQRIQEISEADAQAEGVMVRDVLYADEPFSAYSYREQFKLGWDVPNAKRGYSWGSNPWVWAITFKKL